MEEVKIQAIKKIRWRFHLHIIRQKTIKNIKFVIENFSFEETIEEIISTVPDVEEYYRSKDGKLAKLVEKFIEDYADDVWTHDYDAPDSFMELCDFYETWFTD